MLQGKNIVKTAERIVKEHPEYFDALLVFEKTGKLPKFNYKKRVNFTIDNNKFREFRKYCERHNFKMSAVIEKCIEEKIKDEI